MEASNSIVREMTINADNATVFAFFTDPERLIRWMDVSAQVEPKPGGLLLVDVQALVNLNKDRKNSQLCDLTRLGYLFAGASAVEDVSPQARLVPAPGTQVSRLEPSGVGVLVARFA
jgi:Activator of Hsp90 ATPase homolog 1-like protein